MATKEVYHYCNLEVMYKIITAGKIRVCNALASNDENEYNYAERWIKKNRKFIADDEIGALNLLEDILDSVHEMMVPYVTCFSRHGNILSQWKGYAADGTGVSIGFDIEKIKIGTRKLIKELELSDLKRILKHWKDGACIEIPSIFWTSVEYDEGEKDNFIRAMVNELKNALDDKEETEKIKERMQAIILAALIIFKDKPFKEEDEIRIVVWDSLRFKNGDNERIDEGLEKKFEVRNGKFIGYYELDIKNSITKIILGPKCTIDKNVDYVPYDEKNYLLRKDDSKNFLSEFQDFLLSEGYNLNNLILLRSEIPYR